MTAHVGRWTRLAALLVLLGAGCHREGRSTAPKPPLVSVPLDRVRAVAMPDEYEAVGTVRSRTVVPLSSKILAQVLAVRVHEGDAVRRGQILVELDDRDARAALAKAQAGLRVAASTYRRYRRLLERGSVSGQEYEEVEAHHRAAEAEESAARTLVSYARILSPIDGVVSAKQAEPGVLAAPGVSLLTIESGSEHRLEVLVEEARLDLVHLSDAVDTAIDAIDARLHGRVAEIVPAGDPRSRTFRVKIDLETDPRLRSGMFGRARFTGGGRPGLTVPTSAVVDRGALRAVYVADAQGVARLRLVRVGRTVGDRVEVLSGLDENEQVVAALTVGLREGVRIHPGGAGPDAPAS